MRKSSLHSIGYSLHPITSSNQIAGRSGGSGLPACRRASARRGAGERKSLGRIDKPRLNWIPFDIAPDSLTALVIVDQAIEAFLLPKGLVLRKTEHPHGLVCGKSLQRAQPLTGSNVR